MQMNLQGPARSARVGLAAQWLLAVTAVTSLAACTAAAPPRPEVTAAPAAVEQPSDPERRNRQFQHAEALYLAGHLQEAAAAFEELTRAYPRDSHVWLKYGNALTRLGDYEQAATAFQTALAVDTAQGGAAINLALVRLAQAQGALDTAAARLPAESAEHRQAEALQTQIRQLLGAPGFGPSH
jgi:tetratricopeptide (TPR) repeat protein